MQHNQKLNEPHIKLMHNVLFVLVLIFIATQLFIGCTQSIQEEKIMLSESYSGRVGYTQMKIQSNDSTFTGNYIVEWTPYYITVKDSKGSYYVYGKWESKDVFLSNIGKVYLNQNSLVLGNYIYSN